MAWRANEMGRFEARQSGRDCSKHGNYDWKAEGNAEEFELPYPTSR